MAVVALTGGIGAGKSTVAALLAARGAVIIDADAIARQQAAPGGASYAGLAAHFGPEIVKSDGTLDRPAIAARVFADPVELAALNALTHPAIADAIEVRVSALAGSAGTGTGPPLVIDLPLLDLASRTRYRLAAVVVVDAPVEEARRRLVDQRGLTEHDADARIAAQITRQERRRLADMVVDNSGTPADLEAQVDQLWAWLQRL